MDSFLKVIDSYKEHPQKVAKDAKIQDLERIIDFADDAYYNKGKPVFTDDNYDKIRDVYNERIKSKKKKRKVGAPVSKGRKKIELPIYMSSLDKIKNDAPALERFCKSYPGPYYISLKLDGMSGLYWRTKEGEYYLATRGDGCIGSDIVHLIPFLDLPPLKRGEHVKGELIFNRHVFVEKHQGKREHRDCPRNCVAGLVNAKGFVGHPRPSEGFVGHPRPSEGFVGHPRPSRGFDEDLASDLRFVAYEYYADEAMDFGAQMEKLKRRKFEVVDYSFVEEETLDEKVLEEMFLEKRDTAPYEMDGLVIFNGAKHERIPGRNPLYARAFKMELPEQIGHTTIIRVHWEESRYGTLTPRVEIEPIVLRNATYRFATAHNAKFIKENNVGPGTEIDLIIAGDVIPAIHKVTKSTTAQMPPEDSYEWLDECVIRLVSKSSTSAIRQLVFFWQSLGVKDLGKANVEKLYGEGFLTVRDWIEMREEDIDGIPGIKERLAKKFIDNIRAALLSSSIVDVVAYCGALGRGVGTRRLRPIFDTLDDPLDFFEKRTKELIKIMESVEGVGPLVAKQISNGRKDVLLFWKEQIPESFQKIILENSRTTEEEEVKVDEDELTLKGNVFLFTGVRDTDLAKEIEKRGGRIVKALSGKVTTILVKDLSESNQKIKKAKEMGIVIETLKDFRSKHDID